MWRISRIKNSVGDNQKVYIVTAVSQKFFCEFELSIRPIIVEVPSMLLLSILKLGLIHCEHLIFLSTTCTDSGWLTLIMRLQFVSLC
jgi:hypothetical protein